MENREPMAIDKKLIDQLLTDYKEPEGIIGNETPGQFTNLLIASFY
jgi:hypothetical protein